MDIISPKVPDPDCVRVGPVGAIPALLRIHADEPPEQILSEVGLDPRLFEHPDNSISFVAVGRLLNLCAERTGKPHFGLLVGQKAGPGSLGPFAELAIHAPNVESALQSMILHVCINDRGGVATLTSEHGIAKLGYTVYIPMHEGIRQINNASIAIICNLLRSLCGESWAPLQVLFSHKTPSDVEPYESFFRAPIRFDADEDALVFRDRWLRRPIPSADRRQYRMTVERLTTIQTAMGIDLAEETRSILRPLLVSRYCSHELLARMLSLHPRTLDRRLKEHGTTFRQIVGETRCEIAKQLLMNSDMSVIRISTLLGYAEASAFTRAFRRWSGIKPSAWRMQHKR